MIFTAHNEPLNTHIKPKN